MKELLNLKINRIAIDDVRAIKLFEKYQIDYCCKGDRLLGEALSEKNISYATFTSDLNKLPINKEAHEQNLDKLEPDLLTQYIVNTHHAYVNKMIPQLTEHLEKVKTAHGQKHSFVLQVSKEFSELAREMTSHMMKEEKILFPLVKYLTDSKKFNEKPKTSGFGSIKNPIRQMEIEHVSAGGAMENIRELTNNYSLPKDACTTFKITYEELKEFELDLHQHIHLENNILFPRAIELEEELLKK